MNYGMKVKLKFKETSPFKGKNVDVYRNVTEIHYNYCNGKKFGTKRNEKDFISKMVAFESNIHRTGITQPIEYIEEFETELEKKKARSF